MKRALYLRVLLLVAGVGALAACGQDSLFPGDNQIDPAGGLQRSDYLHLRQRGDENAAAMEKNDVPPISAMQTQTSPQPPSPPGNGKLVSVTVTDSVRWAPASRRADLEIIEVRPEQVRLRLLNSGPAPLIVLRAHQTYQASTGKIVEGMQ